MNLALAILALLINITSYGVPVVKMTVCGGDIYTNVTLPLRAIPSTVAVVNKCSGEVVGYIPSDRYIVVPETTCRCPLEIRYVAYPELSTNLTFILDLDLSKMPSNTSAKLVYSGNIVVVPYRITGLVFLPNNTILLKGGHRYRFEYILLTPLRVSIPTKVSRVKAQNKTAQTGVVTPQVRRKTTANITKNIASVQRTYRTTSAISQVPTWLIASIAGVGIAITVVVTVMIVLRRKLSRELTSSQTSHSSLRGEEEQLELGELDRKIVSVLKEHGGTIMQKDLYKILNVPKTTLWRAVRRLERLGIIRVEKIGRLNRIVLLRDL